MVQGKAINTIGCLAVHRVLCTFDRVLFAGLPGEEYEAKGAVQMAQDEFDCSLEKEFPRDSGSAQFGNGFVLV
jgi:hypothetical protein